MQDPSARSVGRTTATLKTGKPHLGRLARLVYVSSLAILLAVPGLASSVAADPVAVHVGEPDLSPQTLEQILNMTLLYAASIDPSDNATVILEKFNAFLQELRDAVLDPVGAICVGPGGLGWHGLTAKRTGDGVEALVPIVANYGRGYEPAKAKVAINPLSSQGCGQLLSVTVLG